MNITCLTRRLLALLVVAAATAPSPATASPYDALPESVRLTMDKPFTDDFDAMVTLARFAWP
jgi:hypothetical protein